MEVLRVITAGFLAESNLRNSGRPRQTAHDIGRVAGAGLDIRARPKSRGRHFPGAQESCQRL
ncbi:unnamed protein product, partial [Nesidiocoris tenuis]